MVKRDILGAVSEHSSRADFEDIFVSEKTNN